MLKNSAVLRKENRVEWSSLFTIASGTLFALCANPLILPIVVLHLYYVYTRGRLVYTLHATLLTLCTFIVSPTNALVYGVIASVLFLNVRLHEMLMLEVRRELMFWNTCVVLIAAYFLWGASVDTFVLGVITFALHYFFTYVEEAQHTKAIMGFSVASALYLGALSIWPMYSVYFTISYLVVCAYTLPMNVCILIFLYFTVQGTHYLYAMYLLLICHNQKHRLFLSLLAWVSLGLQFELYNVLFSTLCSLMGLLSYQSNDAFMKVTTTLENEHHVYMEHSFYRQLVNYSAVFYDLAKYYEDSNEEQAEMLRLMGEALEYNAKISKNYIHSKRQMDTRIKELLNGYKFCLSSCSCVESEGKVRIEMDIIHMYEGELKDVIVPLVEKVTRSKLRIVSAHTYPFSKEKFSVVLESVDYLSVSTYGKSLHVKEVSGDSFHAFHMDQYAVMMLSDGMGQGYKAQKTSTLLIQIMEAMMRCNIPQAECIKMINLFLRSDIYATLDVLTLDRRANKAYLYKSASAPTYLLRNNELFEMGAQSLPIGIVDNIKADVFEIPYQKGDVFIMNSDGVSKDEIEKWQILRRCSDVKNEGLNLINILQEKRREDDSTILLAKID